ncbi:MAG: hypothetical protein JSR34_01725 [Proteobacteria bacterium]|nr:hypothetical protein [Pseudomonadota bacterium]
MKALPIAWVLLGMVFVPSPALSTSATSPSIVAAASANDAKQIDSKQSDAHAPGTIVAGGDVVDPAFGIHARAIGLERGVQMRQWQPDAQAPGGYAQVWSATRIDPKGLDAAHANPARFPLDGQRWWNDAARLDGKPVAPEVLTVVQAQADAQQTWIALKPDPSNLPTNLAVTFQPDGDALTTSQDPAHPQVGDVRVQWRILASAAAPDGVHLVDGRWNMPEAGVVATASSPAQAAQTDVAPSSASTAHDRGWWQSLSDLGVGSVTILFVLIVLIAILAWGATRHGRRR